MLTLRSMVRPDTDVAWSHYSNAEDIPREKPCIREAMGDFDLQRGREIFLDLAARLDRAVVTRSPESFGARHEEEVLMIKGLLDAYLRHASDHGKHTLQGDAAATKTLHTMTSKLLS